MWRLITCNWELGEKKPKTKPAKIPAELKQEYLGHKTGGVKQNST